MSKHPTKREAGKSEPGMKPEYDFSEGVRGKFFKNAAIIIPPVHLEVEVLQYLQQRATARGMSLNTLVNELLKKDIELIESVI